MGWDGLGAATAIQDPVLRLQLHFWERVHASDAEANRQGIIAFPGKRATKTNDPSEHIY
jgi:hypothetical protein